MLKRLTEEVVIPIPYRAVSLINPFFGSLYFFHGFFFSHLLDPVPFPKGEHVRWQRWIQASFIGYQSKLRSLNDEQQQKQARKLYQ